jgi:GWxTD domain-containing protein
MNKKFFLSALVFILFISSDLPAKKKDKYQEWLNEVNLIITDTEKAEFKKLKKDEDKEFFINLFWAKRDPTPQTEKNEFKEEYYQRLSYVKKSFIYGYKTGTATDMGKVYLYFGEPLRVFRQDPRVIIWVYPAQPWMHLAKETFAIAFSAVKTDWVNQNREKELISSIDSDGYVIDRSQTDVRVMEAFYACRERFLLNPDLKEIPDYKKVKTSSPESFEEKLIQQVKLTSQDKVHIPFEKKILFIKAQNRSCYLTFFFKIDPGEKSDAIHKNLVFFGRLESSNHSYELHQEKDLDKEQNYFISYVGLPVMPGEYRLFIGFHTKDKQTYSIKTDQIEVPDFWSEELALSSLIASCQVREEKPSAKADEYDVFSLGRYTFLPRFSQEYTKEELLNIFYYIYNPAVDPNQECSLLIEFELQKGEKTFKLNPQKRKQKLGKEAVLLEGTQIPLSALPESGEYELTVRVTDEIINKTVSQKLKFVLL